MSDSPVIAFLNKATDLILLNFLWILCSLPVITAGAATAAMYYVCITSIRCGDGYVPGAFCISGCKIDVPLVFQVVQLGSPYVGAHRAACMLFPDDGFGRGGKPVQAMGFSQHNAVIGGHACRKIVGSIGMPIYIRICSLHNPWIFCVTISDHISKLLLQFFF